MMLSTKDATVAEAAAVPDITEFTIQYEALIVHGNTF